MNILEGIEGNTKAWLLGFSTLFICIASVKIASIIAGSICK